MSVASVVRQKRESDSQFFCSVGHDPSLPESANNSRNVLESLDDNVASLAAPQQCTRDTKSTKSGGGSGRRSAGVANLVSPAVNEAVGISESAMGLEPVNLAGVNTNENDEAFSRAMTKQSFFNKSSIYEKWSQPNGKKFHRKLELALKDEKKKDVQNGTTTKRVINAAALAPAVWDMTTFLCTTRNKKTRAKVLVQSIFQRVGGGRS